jgi:hypothetical protein
MHITNCFKRNVSNVKILLKINLYKIRGEFVKMKASRGPCSGIDRYIVKNTSIQYPGGVEGLYCKRPIQCLASSVKLTPPLPHSPASVYLPAYGAGEGDTRWVERGWGINSSEDARHCSVLYLCKHFVLGGMNL